MIYVSSASLRGQSTSASVHALAKAGFQNIELSGGPYEKDLLEKLIELKKSFNLNFLCHNYFPSPEKPFVLNLASLDEGIYQRSVELIQEGIRWSSKLGGNRLGFHAGFYVDIPVNEIGQRISLKKMNQPSEAARRFYEGYQLLKGAANGVQLYVENNVLSAKNYETFQKQNPLMLTYADDFLKGCLKQGLKLLLDVGHLLVSATTLKLSFEEEMKKMFGLSDYIHISDNDGTADQNRKLDSRGRLMHCLKSYSLKDKIVTLEVYGEIKDIKDTYSLIKGLTS